MRKERVLGPYLEERGDRYRRWRVIRVSSEGGRVYEAFDDEKEARRFAAAARRELRGAVNVGEVLGLYERHLKDKGNKPTSIDATVRRLGGWFPDDKVTLNELSAEVAERLYAGRAEKVAVDTHRNELAEMKTWGRWCVTQGWWSRSPFEELEGKGRRRRGKSQFRVGEATAFSEACFAAYRRRALGWEAGLGGLLSLWLGLRAGEVCGLEVRDVDVTPDGRTLLWVASSGGKTEAARRWLDVPEPLAELLRGQAGHAKQAGSEWLFPSPGADKGHKTKTWLRRGVLELAAAAGVPYVCPHGLRGTSSTLAREAGATGGMVAAQLGHTSEKVQEKHYLAPGSLERARVKWGVAALGGGA